MQIEDKSKSFQVLNDQLSVSIKENREVGAYPEFEFMVMEVRRCRVGILKTIKDKVHAVFDRVN